MAFRIPAYRWMWTSNVLATNASRAFDMTQGWLIFELTDSPLMVGLAAGLAGAANLTSSPVAGVLSDRLDRRMLVMASMAVQALVILVLGLLVVTDRIELWHIMAAALVSGMDRAFYGPVRASLVYDVVGREAMMNAMAGQFLAVHGTSAVGPLAAGALLATIGAGPVFLAVAALIVVATGLMVPIGKPPPPRGLSGSFLQNFRDGVNFAVRDRLIRTIMLTIVITETLSFPARTMFPVVAVDILHAGPFVLGLLWALWGVGGTISALTLSSLGNVRNKGWLFMSGAFGLGLMLLLFAFSRSILLSLALLFMAGVFAVIYDTMATTLLQLLAADRMRGRVMGLYGMLISGVSLGALLLGAAASAFGVTAAIASGGATVSLNSLRVGPVARLIAERSSSRAVREDE